MKRREPPSKGRANQVEAKSAEVVKAESAAKSAVNAAEAREKEAGDKLEELGRQQGEVAERKKTLLDREELLGKSEQEVQRLLEQVTARRAALISRERALAEEEQTVRRDRDKVAEDARRLLDRQKELISRGAAPTAAEARGERAPPVGEDEMACPNCRTVISKDAVMCYACGQKLKEDAAIEEAPTEEASASEEEI